MFLLFSLLAAPPAQAAELAVCASGCTYDALDDAISAAAAGDTITLDASSTWTLSASSIDKDLHIVGTGGERVAVHRPESGSRELTLSSSHVTMKNLQLSNDPGMGAIGVVMGSLTLEDCGMEGNELYQAAFQGVVGSILVKGGEYKGNTAKSIFAVSNLSVELSGATVSDNTLTGGGAINSDDAAVVLDRVTLTGNRGAVGAVNMHKSGSSCSLSIKGSTITGNTGTSGPGGVRFPESDCTAEISDSTITDNLFGGAGAGVVGWPDCRGVEGCEG